MLDKSRPITTVKCPRCGQSVEWTPESVFKPFCSERCKQIDLGHWASEDYAIPGPPANNQPTVDPTSEDEL